MTLQFAHKQGKQDAIRIPHDPVCLDSEAINTEDQMKTVLLCLAAAMITLSVPIDSHSDPITIRTSAFLTARYSTDGHKYKGVGIGAKDLRGIMYDCSDCILELNKYRSRATISMITGGTGGALIGWPLGAAIGGREWDGTSTAMVGTGSALAVLSFFLQSSANGHLRKAVDQYNTAEQSDHIPSDEGHLMMRGTPILTVRF